MKTSIPFLLFAVLFSLGMDILDGQTLIYSNSFNGGAVTLNGTAPTVRNGLGGGSSGAKWICTTTNGTSATVFASGMIDTNPGCVLLPFTPQPGCVYFMSASLTVPAGMPNWVAMGFTTYATQTNNATGNYCRFTDNPPGGYAWLGIRANTTQGVYGGRGTAANMGNTTPIPAGTTNLTIILNTIAPVWTVSVYLGGTITGTTVAGGTQMGTNYTYVAGNPAIGFAGIGQTSFVGQNATGIQWNYWTLSVTQMPALANSYWMAPKAIGVGDGSSSANAAGCYTSSTFWSGIQSRLQLTNVTVNLLDGDYTNGTINLDDMGDPLNKLTLQAVNLYGPVFRTTANDMIDMVGSQNIEFYGLVLTGPSPYWAVACQPDYLNPCRDLQFSHCQFINLTNVLYGAIGLVNGVRDVIVDSCTFSNLTANNGNHQHMIYASHNIVDVVVTNCAFQDCFADYVRFRDNSEYCRVQNSTFVSTMSASVWPFISAELYNDTNSDAAGDEFFGNNFQVSSNSFTFNVSGGPAFLFSDTGFSPYSYHCDLTPAEAAELSGGTPAAQQAFVQTNLGINASGIKMFGNHYNSRVTAAIDYTYNLGNAPGNGWSGTIDISAVPDASGATLGATPVLRNGDFDRQGLQATPQTSSTPNECLFQTWFCNPKYTRILWHPGLDGSSNALMFDKTTTQYVYQWITPPGPDWTMDFLFTIGSGFSGTGTKFKVDIFHDDLSGSKISVGVDYLGRFGIYNGSTFIALPELGTSAFSVDNNGNGYYNDPGDVLNVYRLRIVGHYSTATPSVDIYTSDANSLALTHESAGRTNWVNGAPVGGRSSPETVAFYSYTAPAVVDQIALASGLAGQPPVITTGTLSGDGQFVLTGTNGFGGDSYYLLSTTNLSSGSWTLESTNTFAPDGTFSITNTVPTGAPQKFYRLQLQ